MSDSNEQPKAINCLLVDDEDMVRQVAVRQLKRLAWHADDHSHGAPAIENFQAEPDKYKLAIVDLNMPEMPGMEVFSQLRTIKPELPVILVSGDTSTAAITGDPKATLLNKPYRREDLQKAIAQVVEDTTGN